MIYNIHEFLSATTESDDPEKYIESYLKLMPFLLNHINKNNDEIYLFTTFLTSICKNGDVIDPHKIKKYIIPYINFQPADGRSIVYHIAYMDVLTNMEDEFHKKALYEILKSLNNKKRIEHLINLHVDHDVNYNRLSLLNVIPYYNYNDYDMISIIKLLFKHELTKEMETLIKSIDMNPNLLCKINKAIPTLFKQSDQALIALLDTSTILNTHWYDILKCHTISSEMDISEISLI